MHICQPEIYETIIPTQTNLFRESFLRRTSDFFRRQFAGQEPDSHRDWPTIQIDDCCFEQARNLPTLCAGYDQPITFSPDNWNGCFVSFVSQDPLRKPRREGQRFSVASPWGFSAPSMRKKAGNLKIWPVIEGLCERGYGVYLTDAAKLYFHDANHLKFTSTVDLEKEALRREMQAIDAACVVALGRRAEKDLKGFGIPCVFHPHPAAYPSTIRKHYGIEHVTSSAVANAMLLDILDDLGTRSC